MPRNSGASENRQSRAAKPYQQREQPDQQRRAKTFSGGEETSSQCTAKFLLSNDVTGSLMGFGGSVIREVMEITETKVQVGNHRDCFPGTNLRQVLISGPDRNVMHAQNLMWNCVGHHTFYANQGRSNEPWVASTTRTKEYDGSLEVEASIAVPAELSGKVIGRRGSNLTSLREECGVAITMGDQSDEAADIERVLTFRGSLAGCRKACTAVLRSLNETDVAVAAAAAPPRGGRADGRVTGATAVAAFGNSNNTRRQPNNNVTYMDTPSASAGGARRGGGGSGGGGAAARTLSAETTIELAVADNLMPSVIGTRGSGLAEIVSLSGAKINVSNRGEFVAGSNNRLVTIVGPPACAQTAHTLVMHRIKMQIEANR